MTTRRSHNTPEATSLLGQQAVQPPVLTPKLGRPKVGAGAQGEDEQQELFEGQEQEQQAPKERVRPGRSRGGKRPPPAAADAVPTTVRFDPEESSELDWFVLELREDAGRRTLDKAEVIREVLRLAREHEPTKRALVKRLR
ncbi:hypothetical protein AB0F18_33915 [Streptomyces sp. NPDC029216]|uniref:hypothetical protein n=1 Tax=Streptomyces sp. NPDC029216 TaxID=3154701 RepID=UPI0033C3E125